LSESEEHLSFAEALRGRGVRLAAIGFGSLGLEGLFGRHKGLALPCLLIALAMWCLGESPPRPR
jgi:hypothetical protein